MRRQKVGKKSEYHWKTPQEWYESLDDETRKIADRKLAILRQFNANDPLGWISSEMRENIPQVARFLFLHRVRSEVINGHLQFTIPENVDSGKSLLPLKQLQVGEEAFNRLVASGVNQEDLIQVARATACRTALNFVEMLDGVSYSDIDTIANVPSWSIMETVEENNERKLTGRTLVACLKSNLT